MGFVAREVSREVIRGVRTLLDPTVVPSSEMRAQLETAATSVALNLAEACGRTGKDRLNRIGIALGSAKELKAAIESCVDLGFVEEESVSELLASSDRLAGLLWGLRFGRKS